MNESENYIVIDFKQIKKAKRKAARREWINKKIDDVERFILEHQEGIAVATPLLIGTVTVIVKGTKARHRKQMLKKEQNLKELYCYDRSLGHYWKLRRELTNAEWLEIDKRKKNGERLADILSKLKVLD